MPRLLILITTIAGAALLVAACGGGNGYSSGSTPAAASPAASPATAAASPAAVSTAGQTAAATLKVGDSKLGKVLTDAAGFTLYTFKNDTTPGKSSCTGSCAANWPPATATTAPPAPSGVTGTVALITRDDGSQQITFDGKPVYRFAADKAPGDVNGDGVSNVWFAVVVTGGASTSPTTAAAASSGTNYGY
jgi:predicted lipoprotein with Yx(FWY)xxD motif